VVDSLPSRRGSWAVQNAHPDTGGSNGPVSRRAPEGPPTSRKLPSDILHLGDTDLVACAGPCLIVVVDTLTTAGIDAMAKGMARLTQRHEKMCSISVVERQATTSMHPSTRQATTDLTRKYTKQMSAAAVVCEGTGFRATAVRSIVTAIHMASFSSHPSKVFASSGPAVEWLATTQPPGALDVPGLNQAIDMLRSRLYDQLQRAASSRNG
jgi:hypothetical protein